MSDLTLSPPVNSKHLRAFRERDPFLALLNVDRVLQEARFDASRTLAEGELTREEIQTLHSKDAVDYALDNLIANGIVIRRRYSNTKREWRYVHTGRRLDNLLAKVIQNGEFGLLMVS